jgi:beta-galactosidase
MPSIVPRVPGLCYGGDYNPEQWPESVWREDVALMREARVNLVTVGVFGWAWLEPEEQRYEFGRLDRILDLLHDGGIRVDLATATASPPPWFSTAYPLSLPVDADGRRLRHGSRQAICASSPDYLAAALRLVEQLATRYRDHPALAMWHVNNEYGCHNARCYCDTSAAAFRTWLQRRYGDLDGLNDAWTTSFWSQRYTAWEQVLPPLPTPATGNPTQALDFRRFSSDAQLAMFVAERDLLHALSPGVPVTTNLMAGLHTDQDYWNWAREMTGPDLLISNDHYVLGEDDIPPAAQIAYAADLTRSLSGGSPWLLMEHSPSAVNWQRRNLAKPGGRMILDSLGHVARGSDGAMFFQWRASRGGSEKWHSAMVPHAGTDSSVWRDVVALGTGLAALAEIDGSTVTPTVAILLDYASCWAQEGESQPSVDMDAFAEVRRWHHALWRAGIVADFARPEADLSAYRLVVVPSLYLIGDAGAANLGAYAAEGGHVLVGAYSGIVDECDRVRLGGYPGALRDLLGVRVEEFFPLAAGRSVALAGGSPLGAYGLVWAEFGRATTATVVTTFADGPTAGSPALTVNTVGAGGRAWYLGTRLAPDPLVSLLSTVAASAGAEPVLPDRPDGVEAVRRTRPDGSAYLFVLNHSDVDATVRAAGTDLLTGAVWTDSGVVSAGGAVVLREAR